MKLIIAALAYHLAIMPTGGTRTNDNRDLFKPFDVDKTFSSEADCRADVAANMATYLKQRGLPNDAVANFACTSN